MQINEVQQRKQEISHDIWPNIYRNTQTISFQDDYRQNLENQNCQKSKQSLKQVKTQEIKNCIQNKNIVQKNQGLNKMNYFNPIHEKQNKIYIYKDQQRIQKDLIKFKQNSQKIGNRQDNNMVEFEQSNECILNPSRNQIYNIQKSEEQHNFYLGQNKKSQKTKILISPVNQFSEQKLIQSLKKQHLLMFLQNSHINYPIPDHVFQLNNLTKTQLDILETLKPRSLPIGFCYLLEMLNLSYLFPEVLKFEQETISKLVQIFQAPLQSLQYQINNLLEQKFRNYLKLISKFIIEDLTSEKLLTITDKHTNNILNLAKFCQQNQLMQFVFKYNWPLILLQMAKISVQQTDVMKFKQKQNERPQYKKSLQYMKNSILNKNYQIPQKFELRFEIISLLIDIYSKTNSFRELLNKKIQSNRTVNKRKSQLQQQKRNIQQNMKKVQIHKQKKIKKIGKKDKKKSKLKKQECQELSEKQNQPYQSESIQKFQRELEQIQQQIQKQNRQQSLSCCHYLGKDHSNNLYWYVKYFPDKLFIEKNDSTWSYLQIDKIHYLIDTLNKKAINEGKLLEKIQQYYHATINKHLSKMQIETEENNVNFRSGNLLKTSSTILQKNHINFSSNRQIDLQNLNQCDHQIQNDSSKNSIENSELMTGLGGFKIDQDSLLKMIEVGQKKMTQYLKDRNSRWGSQQNKHQLLSTLQNNSLGWLQQARKQISLFNQKICVVEIQYKVFVQQSVQQVDSKIKKIQTKIWGINEKYKHNWYDFINTSQSFTQLFFAVSVLYSLIRKYTSKHRKLRKQYEEIKQKTIWKSTLSIKQWKQSWNEMCQVCGMAGDVLCCDFCPKVYHLNCVNLSEVPQQFKCKSCKQQITTRNQLKSIAIDGKKSSKR